MDSQYELQQEILSESGINIVTCGDCGATILHRSKQTVIVCPDCGFMSEPADFPDLNVVGTTLEMQHPLYNMVMGTKRVLDEVFLNDDDEELNPLNIYFDDSLPYRYTNGKSYFFGVSKDNKITIWELTENVETIESEHREEILEYRLGKFTDKDEVTVADIFMYGKFNKELTTDEYLTQVGKLFGGE